MHRRLLALLSAAPLSAVLLCHPASAETIVAENVLIRLINEVDVPARAVGALVEVSITEGATVSKGELIAKVDDTEARLAAERAELALTLAKEEAENDVAIRSADKAIEFARAEYERTYRAKKLQPRAVSDSELHQAKQNEEQAVLELERVQRDQDLARLREQVAANDLALAKRNVDIRMIPAPQDGIVTSVLHQPGEWVTPGESIFRIVRTDRLRAEGFVKADEINGDLRGKEVTLVTESENQPAITFTGKVLFVSPEIDPVTHQVRVLAEVENKDGKLRPGLRARMMIRTE